MDAAQTKAKQQLKQLAKKGDSKNAKVLAKEVVRSNKQKDRLHVSKARLGSIGVQLQHQLGTNLDDIYIKADTLQLWSKSLDPSNDRLKL